MAGLIMLGLIGLMVLTLVTMLVTRRGLKRTLAAFVGFLIIIGLFNLYVLKTCGPNAKDVETMIPQAEAISDYILKNGIPESLIEIPNLPYSLENCKQQLLYQKYRKVGTTEQYFEEKDKNDAKGEVLNEKCEFNQGGRIYEINIRFSASYKKEINASNNITIFNSNILRTGQGKLILYNEKTETGMSYNYEFDIKAQRWVYEYFSIKGQSGINPKIFSRKNDGVCNPLRM